MQRSPLEQHELTDDALPSADPLVRQASEILGGPLGRMARASRWTWATIAALLVAMASVPVGLGLMIRIPCLKTSWADPGDFWHMCYSDLPNAFRNQHLSDGFVAWLQGGPQAPSTGQPPVLGALMAAVASLVPDRPDLVFEHADHSRARWYFAIWAAIITVCFLLLVITVVMAMPRTPWAAAQVALAPTVMLAAYVSADLVGVLLATVGMLLWLRRRPTAAGLVFGLAIGVRIYPVIIVAAIVLLALRESRDEVIDEIDEIDEFDADADYAAETARDRATASTRALRLVAATALTTAFIWGAFGLVNSTVATESIRNWIDSGAGYGSPWYITNLGGVGLSSGWVTVLAVAGWAAALAVGARLALRSRVAPALAEVSFVMVAIVLITGKAFTVQSSLWLLPLVAMSLVPWRDYFIWSGAEALYFIAVWLTAAGSVRADRAMPGAWYVLFLGLRIAAVIWLVTTVWLEIKYRRPARVPVGSPASWPTGSPTGASSAHGRAGDRAIGDATPA